MTRGSPLLAMTGGVAAPRDDKGRGGNLLSCRCEAVRPAPRGARLRADVATSAGVLDVRALHAAPREDRGP